MATTQYASYERIATVATYTYTATVVTEAGKTTATLTARQDLDCPRRRECQCPKCHSWMPMHWNVNLQAYEPIHCTGCVLGLYDIVLQPAVVTEPAASEEASPVATIEQVSAGIEHIKDVLAAWDAACEDEPQVAEVAQAVDTMIERIDGKLASAATEIWDDEFDEPYVAPNEELSQETLALMAADTTVLNLNEPLALEQPPVWMQPENACEASTEVEPMDEQDALIAELAFEADAVVDRERYFAARSGKYVLLHMRESGMAVGCSCPSRVKKLRYHGVACKHMTAHNDMLTPATKTAEAA